MRGAGGRGEAGEGGGRAERGARRVEGGGGRAARTMQPSESERSWRWRHSSTSSSVRHSGQNCSRSAAHDEIRASHSSPHRRGGVGGDGGAPAPICSGCSGGEGAGCSPAYATARYDAVGPACVTPGKTAYEYGCVGAISGSVTLPVPQRERSRTRPSSVSASAFAQTRCWLVSSSGSAMSAKLMEPALGSAPTLRQRGCCVSTSVKSRTSLSRIARQYWRARSSRSSAETAVALRKRAVTSLFAFMTQLPSSSLRSSRRSSPMSAGLFLFGAVTSVFTARSTSCSSSQSHLTPHLLTSFF